MTPNAFRLLARPAWLALIIISVLAAAGAALYMGLQQDTKQTATTFVFGQRVGYIDRPNPVLDEHLNGIVNAVEFPDVFFAIEDRTQLSAEDDYSFTIARIDDTQSVIRIDVRADRAGDAERIARILGEEVVNFVLRAQEETLTTQIIELDQSIGEILDDQNRLRRETLGVNPVLARNRTEGQLLGLDADDEVVGTLEGELRSQLSVFQPLAEQFNRNLIELNGLYADRARTVTERSDVIASLEGVNDEWYRSITPVEPASNVPVAIAMAFAAGVPALAVSAGMILLHLNRTVTRTAAQNPSPGGRFAAAA